MPRRDLMTQAEVADMLGVTTRTIHNWTAQGRLTAYKLGEKLIRYDAAEVEKILLPIPAVADQAAEQ